MYKRRIISTENTKKIKTKGKKGEDREKMYDLDSMSVNIDT